MILLTLRLEMRKRHFYTLEREALEELNTFNQCPSTLQLRFMQIDYQTKFSFDKKRVNKHYG